MQLVEGTDTQVVDPLLAYVRDIFGNIGHAALNIFNQGHAHIFYIAQNIAQKYFVWQYLILA